MAVGGKRRVVLSALFPGYFFARICLATAARFVASRPGIIGLVRFGEKPTPLPDPVIEEMQDMDFVTAAESILTSHRFIPGQRLLIREGPFAGMEAEYVASLNDGQRALLLLEYLHQRVNLVANCSMLESAA
jgi:transcriptional antiterminator RfaH